MSCENLCNLCQEHSHRNVRDVTLPREIPIQAWTTIQMDLFTLEGHTFLLVVDMTSRFPIVRILNSETTKSVLNALKGVYCNFGLPKKVLTDNGPCFRSVDFNEFHTKLGVTTETISSYNHASLDLQNGWFRQSSKSWLKIHKIHGLQC